jgi:hypothetical protein
VVIAAPPLATSSWNLERPLDIIPFLHIPSFVAALMNRFFNVKGPIFMGVKLNELVFMNIIYNLNAK